MPLLALLLDQGGRDGADERPLGRERGSPILEWSTAPDNATAQRLYDSTGAERSTWIEYQLGL